jgi:hypothetical protein
MTPAQEALKAKHGTPEEFEVALYNAFAQLFITWDELVEAASKYRQEWHEAGRNAIAEQSTT